VCICLIRKIRAPIFYDYLAKIYFFEFKRKDTNFYS